MICHCVLRAMCLCAFSVVFWVVEGSIPSRWRKQGPKELITSLPKITPVQETPVQRTPIERKETMSLDLYCKTPYPAKEHIKWCGASEEAIISMLRFQNEIADRRVTASGSDSGLNSDQETLLDGEPGIKVLSEH